MKPWHQFKQENPDGFYSKDYSDHAFIVYQHPTSGHLNGYVLLNPKTLLKIFWTSSVTAVSRLKAILLRSSMFKLGTGSDSTVLITMI